MVPEISTTRVVEVIVLGVILSTTVVDAERSSASDEIK
jgi:hypothetical protein